MLILKQNAANSVPTPPAGKGTIFLDDSDTLSVKTSDGNVENFPTVAASNAQVVFINGTSLSGEAAFTYDFNNNVLNISGNVAAGNIKTDNLLYANGTPWDLSDPGGSNTQIQFNDDESFGGSPAFTFDKSSNLVTVSANLNSNNINVTTHITSGNVWANSGTIGASLLTGTLTTAAQPNVTSLGSLTSLTVTGNAGANNFNATTHVTAGNVWANSGTISAQTLKGEAGNLSNITAGNITGQVANALVAGTVYTAAQPNITSVGTLTSLSVTGTASAGNLSTGGNLSVSGNAVVSGNLTVDGNLVYVNVETLAVEDPIIQLQTGPNGAAPSSNSGKDIGSALNYYDSQARVAFMGWDVSNAEFGLASQTTITNEVVTFTTYGNLRAGVYFGNANGLTNIPGANIVGNISGNISNANYAAYAGQVVDATQSNITSVGTLTSLSVSGNASAGNISTGGVLSVTGNANVGNLGTAQVLASANITAPQLISNVSTGTAPLVVTSTTRVANLDVAKSGVANTVNDAAQPNITSVGTLTSLAITGNATAGNVYANSGTVGASLLTGTLTTAAQPNITSVGTLSSLTVTGNAGANNFNATTHVTAGNVWANSGTVGASLLTGTLTTAAQPNITSVGTLGNLSVTSNISAGNVKTDNLLYSNGNPWDLSDPGGSNTQIQFNDDESFGGSAAFTFDKSSNLVTVGANLNANNLNATTHISAGNVYANSGTVGASLLTGTLTTAAQPNITSVGTLTSLTVSGNISGGNITGGALANGNSNVNIPAAAGNVNISVNGTANVAVVTGTGVNVAGTLNATGNANVGNLGTGGLITATGNVTGGNLTTAGALSVTGNANVGNLGTGGLITATGNVSGGNITTAGQLVSSIATGTAPLVVSSTTKVANLNADLLDGFSTATAATANTVVIRDADGSFSANIITATLSGAATTAGTVTTAAQPNITSVGTLTSLGVSGNVTAANITANTGVFTGNGSGLSAIPGGNVTGQVANALVAGTVYTAAQPNITSVGTLSSLAVTGNATAGNVYANSGTVGASLLAGTLTTAAQPNVTSVGTLTSLAVTGNGTFGNVYANSGTVGASLLAGTLTTAAQPNVTSVGTLTSLAVTGNVTAGNVYSNSGTIGASLLNGTLTTAAQPNVTSVGTLSSLAVTGNVAAGNLTTTGVLSVTGTGTSSIAGNLDMTSNTIINLATPTNASDAATKQYVDDVAQGLNIHDSCAAATPDTLANITSGTITYNNGTAGVGATLVTTGTFNLIDGVNVQTSGTRILVKNEANAVFNGIYTYTNTTAITRATDFNSIPEVEAGDFTFVTGGTLYDNTGWVQTESPTGIGTAGNNISFTQFSGAGTYNAGTGLTLTGTTFSVNASQTQVTALGTVTSGTWNSLVGSSATFAAGLSGANLASITGANVTGTVPAATTAGTVTTAAQPNITSVGTLTSLGVNGTVTAVAFTANTGVFTGNGSGLSAIAGANVTGTVSAATTAGTVTTAAQPNITSVGTLSSVAVTGNANVGNLNAATAVVASTLTSNVATGTAPLTVTSTTRVANLNVAYANVADNINVTTQSSGNAYLIFANALTGNVAETANASFVANTSNGALYATTFIGAHDGNGAALTTLNASNISSGTLAQARLANSTITFGNTTLTLGATTTTVAGLTNITSTQFTSNVATGTAPLVVTSTTQVANLNVATSGTAGTVTTAAQPNITSVGTLTSLGVNGTVTAVAFTANTGVFTGNGSGLSAIAGANVTGTVSSATTAGTVTTAAQPNITSLGTLTGLGVNGTITAVNITANTGVFTGNANGISSVQAANIVGTTLSSTVVTSSLTTVGTLGSLNVSGNITAPNLIANTGFVISSVNAAVSAAGTAQGNATALTREINVTSTVASGAGVVLPTAVAGMRLTIINTAANAVLVYPASGGQINSLGTNASFSQGAGAKLDFVATSTTQWYTLNATYL